MKKISTKIAAMFLLALVVLEGLLMMYLHPTIMNVRVEEEYARLLEAGAKHRDVLADHNSQETIRHIVQMESGEGQGVAIVDAANDLVAHSEQQSIDWDGLMTRWNVSSYETDTLIQAEWEEEPYLISIHPFSEGQGAILQLQSTSGIHALMDRLNFHFLLAGIVSVLILTLIYVFLTRYLTLPLQRMKRATEKLSVGHYDVTLPAGRDDELGQLATSIQKLSTDLQAIKKNRTDFLSSVSHELRTPLTYVMGYTRVARRPDTGAEEQANYLQIIEEEAQRLTLLVEDLFDLAQLDDPGFRIVKESVDLAHLLGQIHTRVAPSFAEQGKELLLTCEAPLPLEADPVRLEQVIVNLLDNARHYSAAQTTTQMRAYARGKTIVMEVKDEGIGIAEEEQEMIFERLYRTEKSRSRAHGGSGLGLSIVKELVEAHGGTIEVQSKRGQGSTFTVILNKRGDEVEKNSSRG